MKDADDEYLFIREVELDDQGGAVYPRHSGVNRDLIVENDARPPLACYFGKVLGNNSLGRNWRGSNRIEQYSLKKRSYLGPTSMDAELSMIMTNLAQIRQGSMVFDPFVGTGSILLTAALRGAYTVGTDIDLRVLRGRSQHENIASNFKQYGLLPPELVRSDNAIYHRHYREHAPLFDAIVTDPPYGIRAGAKKSGSRREGDVRSVLDKHRYDHVAQTQPYSVSDVMADLLNVAARILNMGGRLVYVIPSMQDFDPALDLPRHECLRLVSVCYQPLQTELGRRTVTMKKIKDYDQNKKSLYLEDTWANGAESAAKVANIRARLIEAAKKKPDYEKKAAFRKQKRKATKEAKKKAKREAAAEELAENHQRTCK
jgi:tRNA (guanine10-N2)-methyltransferase